jgi:N-acyl amino acid synthase of PEP-CTERM/exosortase system
MSGGSCGSVFRCSKAIEQTELQKVYELRYKSYCEEWGFERPEDYPDKLESDVFDKYSVHFLSARIDTRNVIATIRLILNSELGFPFEKHCRIDEDISHLDRNKMAEISRLAISKHYLRRTGDHIYDCDFGPEELPPAPEVSSERRKRQEIICGLYRCIYQESKEKGLTHWFAVMSRGLYILLKRLNMTFIPIGPEIDYHGPRRPYLGCIADIEREVSTENPDLFAYFAEQADS